VITALEDFEKAIIVTAARCRGWPCRIIVAIEVVTLGRSPSYDA
jgi:hypothetical protein